MNWIGYAIGASFLYGLHQIFTKLASKGIGDSENLLKKNPDCFLYNHHSKHSTEQALEFIEYLETNIQEKIRAFGIEYFSLEESALTYVKSLNLLQ